MSLKPTENSVGPIGNSTVLYTENSVGPIGNSTVLYTENSVGPIGNLDVVYTGKQSDSINDIDNFEWTEHRTFKDSNGELIQRVVRKDIKCEGMPKDVFAYLVQCGKEDMEKMSAPDRNFFCKRYDSSK